MISSILLSAVMASCPYQVSFDGNFPSSLISAFISGNYTEANGFLATVACNYDGIAQGSVTFDYADFTPNNNDFDIIKNSTNWQVGQINPIGYFSGICKRPDPNYAGYGCQIQATTRFFVNANPLNYKIINWVFPFK